MKIKLIDFGLKADHHPFRPHENDAGADVFMVHINSGRIIYNFGFQESLRSLSGQSPSIC